VIVLSPGPTYISYSYTAGYSLFVLKVLLNTNKLTTLVTVKQNIQVATCLSAEWLILVVITILENVMT